MELLGLQKKHLWVELTEDVMAAAGLSSSHLPDTEDRRHSRGCPLPSGMAKNQDFDVSRHLYLFLKPQALQHGPLPSLASSLLPSLPRIPYLVLVSHFHISKDCYH